MTHKTKTIIQSLLLAGAAWIVFIVVISLILAVSQHPAPLPDMYQGKAGELLKYYSFKDLLVTHVVYFVFLVPNFPVVLSEIARYDHVSWIFLLMFFWPFVFIPIVAKSIYHFLSKRTCNHDSQAHKNKE